MYASSISDLPVIKGYLATAVAKMITKEAGKGLLGIVTASIGAIAVSSLFDQLVPAFAKGGVVTGSGGTDTINARLTAGEYVINRRSAGAIGYDKLNSLNRVGFAEGCCWWYGFSEYNAIQYADGQHHRQCNDG